MKIHSAPLLLGTIVLLLMIPAPRYASAQPPPGITENPEGAVRLRTIWRLIGTGDKNTVVGTSVGALGDVDRDGYSDVSVGIGGRHHIFRGGDPMSLTAVQIIDSTYLASVETPTVGDFYGTGEKLYGYIEPNRDDFSSALFVRMRFYRYAPENPDSFLVRTGLELNLPVQFARSAFYASDLDRDGADELIFINKEDDAVVVRIYQGGEDFQLEVPDWEFAALENATVIRSAVTDVDGDHLPDLQIGEYSTLTGNFQILWFLQHNRAYIQWGNGPDRQINLSANSIGPDPVYAGYTEDVDGDSIPDIFGLRQNGDSAGTYVWLSRNRESVRTRSFTRETADIFFPQALRNRGFGYAADSLQRYEMMTLLHLTALNDAYGLGGGANGPNFTYDAHFGGSDGPAFGGIDAGDVDGNGWRDRLIASPTYGGPGVGGAVIVAGGPYIPSDDPTVSVNDAPVAGVDAGMHLWPNPVRDRLHLAWRGDLTQMPRFLRIFDLQGRLVSETPLAMWSGIVEINVAELPPGSYTALLLNPERQPLGDIPFIIQR